MTNYIEKKFTLLDYGLKLFKKAMKGMLMILMFSFKKHP